MIFLPGTRKINSKFYQIFDASPQRTESGMSDSLRDQLLQKGLVTEEQAKKAKQPKQGKRPRSSSRRSRGQQSQGVAAEEAGAEKKLAALVHRSRVSVSVKGSRRWYFEARDGHMSYLSVSEPCAELLEQGAAAIVELNQGACKIVTRSAAQKIQTMAPSWLRYWHSSESET